MLGGKTNYYHFAFTYRIIFRRCNHFQLARVHLMLPQLVIQEQLILFVWLSKGTILVISMSYLKQDCCKV